MTKHRQYSIVIHNVDQQKTQEKLEEYVKKAKEYVMSVEPYPQGNGFHLHLFLQYPNQRSFKSVLREMEKLSGDITTPRPEGESRAWGRVQVDVMRGTFKDCTEYLDGTKKDKPTGEVKSGKRFPPPIIRRMIALAMWKVYDYGEERPALIKEFDEEYGLGFSEACYDEWHDYIWDRENPQ